MSYSRRSVLHIAALGPFLRTGLNAASVPANSGPGILAVGVGGRGTGIALAAASHGRILAVCDADSAQSAKFLQALAKRQAFKPETHRDYRRFLERKDIDAVTIGTPDHWHTKILIDAVQAGKDVYCEKPLTLTIDEGRQICRAVRKTGRVVQVGTQQRTEFKQVFLQAVALARSGRLGDRLTATCFIGAGSTGGPYPTSEPPSTLDWDFWLGQAPVVPYAPQRCHRTFRWWLEYSGGKLTDWGAHHIDIAHWALGVENTGPIEIEGKGEWPLGREATLAFMLGKTRGASLPNAYNTPRTFQITLRFANGNTIIVKDGPGNGIEIAGEKGKLFVSRKAIEAPAADPAWLDAEVRKLYRGKVPSSHMLDFIECVKDRKQPVSDVFTHHRAMTSCHLCNISMLVGRKLKWDPVKERILGDSEAAALVSRRQRKPYRVKV